MDEGPRGWGTPLYERVLAGIEPGTALLDVGCGPGTFAAFASRRGMVISGADSDRSALSTAEFVAGSPDLRLADAHEMPWPDASFGLVTLVQVLEHVPDPLGALREAARLCRSDGRVRATVWGRPSECEMRAIGEVLAPFLPRPRDGVAVVRTPSGISGSGRVTPRPTGRASSLLASRSGGPPLTEPDRLRKVVGMAGLRVAALDEVQCTFAYGGDDELADSVLESGPGRRAVMRSSGPRVVRRAVLSGLRRFRDDDGGYRLRNTFRVLDATPV